MRRGTNQGVNRDGAALTVRRLYAQGAGRVIDRGGERKHTYCTTCGARDDQAHYNGCASIAQAQLFSTGAIDRFETTCLELHRVCEEMNVAPTTGEEIAK